MCKTCGINQRLKPLGCAMFSLQSSNAQVSPSNQLCCAHLLPWEELFLEAFVELHHSPLPLVVVVQASPPPWRVQMGIWSLMLRFG